MFLNSGINLSVITFPFLEIRFSNNKVLHLNNFLNFYGNQDDPGID